MRHSLVFVTILILLALFFTKMSLAQTSPAYYQRKVDSLQGEGNFLAANRYLEKIKNSHQSKSNWKGYLTINQHILVNLMRIGDPDMLAEKAHQIKKPVDTLKYDVNKFKSFLFSALSYANGLKGNTQKAIEYDAKALEIYRKTNNLRKLAGLFLNMGISYESLGAFDIAENYLNKAISTLKQRPDSMLLGTTYSNLSIVCWRKKEFNKALKYAKKTLVLRKKVLPKKHPNIDHSHQLLGLLYNDTGNYEQALQYFNHSLSYRKKQYGNKHPFVASANLNIANVYKKQQKYNQALIHYHKSLYIRKKHKQNIAITNTFNAIGTIYQKQSKTQKASESYQKALCYNSKTFKDSNNIAANPGINQYNNGRFFLETLRGKASVLLSKGDANSLRIALKTYQLCDKVIQKFRHQYIRHQDKLTLAKISADVYENALVTCYRLIGLQKQQEAKYTQLAFHFSERNKASILQGALQEANARFGLPENLLEQERDLKVNLAYYEKQLANAQSRKDSTKIAYFRDKMFDLNQQHETLTKNLEKNYPRYYQLKYKTSLASVASIQQSLPDKTLLIEYFTTREKLYAFVLSKNQLKMLALSSGTPFKKIIRKYARSIKMRKRAPDFAKASYEAYQYLITPLAPYLAGKDQLIVIADGKLLGVPFEALISSVPSELFASFDKLDFLLKKYRFSYHYSANLMMQPMLRKQPLKRCAFLGIAPVFTKNQESASRNDETGKQPQALPYTEKEIDKITEIFKQNRQTQTKSILHQKATEASFKTIGHKYRYVHLATHSITNSRHPELAYIQFEPTPDNQNNYNEGKLYANEIYALNLNADLVVLSSCESGSGKIERGEGMMGLNRSFLYAGARHVMYSLWRVKDKPTSELMINFYKHLIVNKLPFNKALQRTKLEYIKKYPTKRPHDWSGFLIIGQF